MVQPKPNIDKLFPHPHGGLNYHEISNLGLSAEDIIDFSSNCNPYGPPPEIAKAISSSIIDIYPDTEATELKEVLASKLNISQDHLLIGNGSTELIRLVALAYFGHEDHVLILKPTYGEYELACHLVDAKVLHYSALNQPYLHFNTTDIVNLICQHQPKGIFLCNPNNPTGQYLSQQEIEQILSSTPKSLLILDEAYIAFTEGIWSSLDLLKKYNNLIILRSMTKDYALAGLRLGYAIAAEPIISTLKRVRPPWNVNAVAQKAGVAVLQADTYLKECNKKIHESKDFLIKEITSLGLQVFPSQTNVFLVKLTNVAFEFRYALLHLNIAVRECSSFGLPNYIRIAPRTRPECEKLVEATKAFLLK
jgi:histidinol-phosphate aminotransferase